MTNPPNPVHAEIATLFGVLHDGSVKAGEHTGDTLVLTVAIRYLLERLERPALSVRVTLRGVRDLLYFPWPNEGEVAKPGVPVDEILANGPDILKGEVTADDRVLVSVLRHGRIDDDAGGELRFSAAALEIHDDQGMPRTITELLEGSRRYWADWSAKNAAKQP